MALVLALSSFSFRMSTSSLLLFFSFLIRLYTLFRQCSRFVYSSFFLFLRFSSFLAHSSILCLCAVANVHPQTHSVPCCNTLHSCCQSQFKQHRIRWLAIVVCCTAIVFFVLNQQSKWQIWNILGDKKSNWTFVYNTNRTKFFFYCCCCCCWCYSCCRLSRCCFSVWSGATFSTSKSKMKREKNRTTKRRESKSKTNICQKKWSQ